MIRVASQKRGLRRLVRKLILLFACRISLIPSKRIRPWLCRLGGVNVLDPNSTFIGDDVRFDSISPHLITVGKNVRITAGVSILNHFLDTSHIPTKEKPFQFFDGEIRIGDGAFIGVNAIICKAVVIGEQSVIGAGSVVIKDVESHAIVAGSPARMIGRYGYE